MIIRKNYYRFYEKMIVLCCVVIKKDCVVIKISKARDVFIKKKLSQKAHKT